MLKVVVGMKNAQGLSRADLKDSKDNHAIITKTLLDGVLELKALKSNKMKRRVADTLSLPSRATLLARRARDGTIAATEVVAQTAREGKSAAAKALVNGTNAVAEAARRVFKRNPNTTA
jgi:hypothetical protein